MVVEPPKEGELDRIEETISRFIVDSPMTREQQAALEAWIRLCELMHRREVLNVM